jgi:hypothetical protein
MSLEKNNAHLPNMCGVHGCDNFTDDVAGRAWCTSCDQLAREHGHEAVKAARAATIRTPATV